jgi:hypothetical protein
MALQTELIRYQHINAMFTHKKIGKTCRVKRARMHGQNRQSGSVFL